MVILNAIFATTVINFLVNLLPLGRAGIQTIRPVVIAAGLGVAYRDGVVR